MLTIVQSTHNYEAWLRAQLGNDLVEADLQKKHARMRDSSFAFLRATYWRWSETILDICPQLASAPKLLAIGDTHLENFGTWRDAEGRLVWGANDFDDAAVMPYALDLVRLAASAILAREGDIPSSHDICDSILGGYRRGLAAPSPIILERDHKWLRNTVLLPNSEREDFWQKFEELKPDARPVPPPHLQALRSSLPEPATAIVAMPRTAGTGSLGRPRFVVQVEWRGGPLLRESKSLLQSAWSLRHDPRDTAIHAAVIADGAARSPDPEYKLIGTVLVRRLSPNSRKIEVKNDPSTLLSSQMLDLMGFEIANCHVGDAAQTHAILSDLRQRDGDWLRDAAKAAVATIEAEQKLFAASP
ncbi:DUF2252 family protein [Rhizobium sp. BK376]|jgi:hypothetical protein|uniref:DUF2252 family protein n=1 Tax=Rhizobium sp. BK376 TaxID=2512149 RepID=UPI001053F044|nr:DUF2252 family protein [Rhizobium sp. BK376]TCR91733.1 uncharacterized protein DUF2252 [Rhizobium sp. BK376]